MKEKYTQKNKKNFPTAKKQHFLDSVQCYKMKEIDRWKNENFNTNRKVQRYTHRDEKKE